MSDLSTLPKGDSAWLLRKAIERIIQQVSVLETNIGSSTTGNSANTQIIFNDNGTLRGDTGLVFNKTTDALTVAGLVTAGSATITGDLTVATSALKVDSTTGRVAINTATFASAAIGVIQSSATRSAGFIFNNSAGTYGGTIGLDAAGSGGGSQNVAVLAVGTDLSLYSGNALQHKISNPGVFNWYDGVGGTRMTLNSTGLGIGVSPGVKLDVLSASAEGTIRLTSTIDGSTASPKGSSLSFRSGSSSTETARIASFNRFSNVNGGDLVFSTADSSQVLQTRATIDSSGNLLMGVTATPSGSIGGSGFISDSNSRKQLYLATTSTSSQVLAIFLNPNGVVGTIETNGSLTAYNISSDYRLKQQVKPLTGGLARVNALKPSSYNWKSDGSTGEGFLAHELAEVVPFAVSGEKDAVNEDGSMKTQGVDLSKLVPILVAAIQELTAEVNALKNA